MPETQSQTYSYGDPAFVAMLQGMFPGIAQQLQGMLGGGGADTGALHGVGQQFQNLYGQLQEGPNATQQGGLTTLQQAQDMGKIQDAYKSAFGAITAPTLVNNAIAGGLGAGAATEATGLAGAQAGVDLTKLQNAAQGRYGQAQVDVGSGLTNDMLRALGGAGGVYSNEGQIQNQARGQDITGLLGLISGILGYKPQQTGATNSAPFWPTNLQNTIGAIGSGAGLIQKGGTALGGLNWPGGGVPGSGFGVGNPPIGMPGGGYGGAWEMPMTDALGSGPPLDFTGASY